MNRHLRGLAVTAGLLITTSAAAGVSPNGLMPNGLMPNGLMPNGLMPNGLMPNGLMPNGLMPNGLMPNGLMPNGLMPNGLMPNGLTSYAIYGDMYAVVDGVNVTFDQWFAVDPAARSNFMKYFVRCAYGPKVVVTYQSTAPAPDGVSSGSECSGADGEKCDHDRDDSTGSESPTYQWQGHFGLSQTTLDAGAKMTADEAKWISGCLLAFVNTKGTHQYLSLRLAGTNPPSEAARQALTATRGELWTMPNRFGWFFGDLTAPVASKYSCDFGWDNYYFHQVESVLGRTCDNSDCTYVDPAGQTQHILTRYLGFCPGAFPGAVPRTDPVNDAFSFDGEAYYPFTVWGPSLGEFEAARELQYGGNSFSAVNMIDVASCASDASHNWCGAAEAHFDKPLVYWRLGDPTEPWPPPGMQRIECPDLECLGDLNMAPGTKAQIPGSGKLVGLVDRQAVDVVAPIGDPTTGDLADSSEGFTAIIRYTKGRTGSANLWASSRDGGWWDATAFGDGSGPDVWKSTGTSTQFEWLQVYPVFPVLDPQTSGGGQALKIRVSGAPYSESCTGPQVFKTFDRGACSKPFTYPLRNNTVCPKEYESEPRCLGELVWTKRYDVWGWYCRGGVEALYTCTADDAPELDAAGFVPGKPWCMPEGATSFVGVCK